MPAGSGPVTATARDRLAQRLVDGRPGMHPQVARNVVEHVAEHGAASPWAREVHTHRLALMKELYSEAARKALRALAPALRRLGEAVRAAELSQEYALAPPRSGVDAQRSPYGPAKRKRA